MFYLLHTKRLHLRPSQLSDLTALHALWIEPEVRRFLFDDRQISIEETQSFLQASLASFIDHGYGIWLFFEPEQEQIAGFAGLFHVPAEMPSLIFGTRPQLWSRGYATEAAAAVLDHAFKVLNLECVVADVDEPNVASIRVLENLGMVQTHRAIVNDRPLLYYKILAPTAKNP